MKGEELPRPLKAALESLACFRTELALSQRQVLAKLDSELERFRSLQPPTPSHEAGRSPNPLPLSCTFIIHAFFTGGDTVQIPGAFSGTGPTAATSTSACFSVTKEQYQLATRTAVFCQKRLLKRR